MANNKNDRQASRVNTKSTITEMSYKSAIGFLALGFGFLHRWHVSTLFENDRYFSHLSEIEREMSFRTEMGMYYHYFKTIAESNSFIEGLAKVSRDNLSEYNNVIDAGKKYNLLPEMIAGMLYHVCKSMGLIRSQCWQIERGDGLPSVTSCEGLGVPVYFYLEMVWYCATITGAVLFLYGLHLSDTVYGGLIAILSFFYNHSECTRVQWTPPLRESFAYPALLFQMYKVTMIMKEHRKSTSESRFTWKEICTGNYMEVTLMTVTSLHCWQFSQFILSTQIIAFLILKWLCIIPENLYKKLYIVHVVSLITVLIATQSSLLLCSLYTAMLASHVYVKFVIKSFQRFLSAQQLVLMEIFQFVITTELIKSLFLGSANDEHVYNILKSKLSSYRDFHTMLYTCSPEFDFFKYETMDTIVRTLLLPSAALAGVLVLYYWYRNYRNDGYPRCIEPHLAYNFLQLGAFVVMAVFVMRLKLFMTPHLCIVSGLVAGKKYFNKFGLKSDAVRAAFVILLIGGMSHYGIQRFEQEREIVGEYSNIEQEELFEWIKAVTPKNAVFAGKMSLMANLMLSTQRPIVNNPYYESKEMRDRTTKVYQIFSRRDANDVYETLKKMKVDYVVLEEGICYGYGKQKPGCTMLELWDLTDNGVSKKAGRQPLCPILFRGNAKPFTRVFVNQRYVLLRLDQVTLVKVKPQKTLPVVQSR